MKVATKILYLLCFFILVSCSNEKDNPTQPSNPSLTGTWVGTGSGIVINATLSQTGTSVSGEGTVGDTIYSVDVIFYGTNVYPNISLTITSDSSSYLYLMVYYTGTFTNNNTHSGTLSDSTAITYPAITFVRQ